MRHHEFAVVVAGSLVKAALINWFGKDCGLLHLRLRFKHCHDELQDAGGVEGLDLGIKLAMLDQLHVEHVVHQAEQQI